jgi:peptide subunit release factor RF-3
MTTWESYTLLATSYLYIAWKGIWSSIKDQSYTKQKHAHKHHTTLYTQTCIQIILEKTNNLLMCMIIKVMKYIHMENTMFFSYGLTTIFFKCTNITWIKCDIRNSLGQIVYSWWETITKSTLLRWHVYTKNNWNQI